MPTMWAMEEFLTHRRFALVGVGAEPDGPVRRMLASMHDQGWDVVPVGPPDGDDDPTVAEPGWYRHLADVPRPLDGAVLVVRPEQAAAAIDACAAAGVHRVWLHAAAVGDAEAVRAVRDQCDRLGLTLVLGTCPLLVSRLIPGVPDPERTPTLVPVGGTASRTTGRWRRVPARTRPSPGCDLARTGAGWPCGGHAGCRPR